ncbi:hypothetical protein BDF14DRAFT_1757503 [Spinellus fusiger]|nr:hypothetical protein BDF14DRAFT_1757503 [Spinellus fusiger]
MACPIMFLTNTRKKLALTVTGVTILLLLTLHIHSPHSHFALSNHFLHWSSPTKTPDTPPPPPPFVEETHEKYITYLPYSRFSNQRSTLLNACLLAKLLNRTLLVPPMILGSANGWSPAPNLYSVLKAMTDAHYQEKCFSNENNENDPVALDDQGLLLFGCTNFTSYEMLPWGWATDLHQLARPEKEGGLGIRIVERKDMSLHGLQQQLGLSSKDIFTMQDTTRYQWHIVDTLKQPANPRYQYEISLNELAGIRERMLHFYGLFGYDRIALTYSEHQEDRRRIEQALIFKLKAVSEASSVILQQIIKPIRYPGHLLPLDPEQAHAHHLEIKGTFTPPHFVAAHIRAGDGVFLRGLEDRVPEFVHQLWAIMTGNETTLDDLVGASNSGLAPPLPVSSSPLPKAPLLLRQRLLSLPLKRRIRECVRTKTMVLYVATDAQNPRHHRPLRPILEAFPCTVFMADFDAVWQVALQQVRSPLDPHKSLSDSLVMFVDASICAWAERFVGTRTSTFTNYIKQYRHAIFDEIIEHQHLN